MRIGRFGYAAIALLAMSLASLVISFQFDRSEFGTQDGVPATVFVVVTMLLLSCGFYMAWLDALPELMTPPRLLTCVLSAAACLVISFVSTVVASWGYVVVEMHVAEYMGR